MSDILMSCRRSLQEMAKQVYEQINRSAFDGRLPPDTAIVWSNRLRTTAGRAWIEESTGGTICLVIELSAKLLSSTSRLADTLAHEMCHLAAWVLEGTATPRHGKAFQDMAQRVQQVRLPCCNLAALMQFACSCCRALRALQQYVLSAWSRTLCSPCH